MLKVFTQKSLSLVQSCNRQVPLILALLLIIACPVVSLADCGCDYVVPSGKHEIDGKALGIGAGDVVCLQAGTAYGNLKFLNIVGTASNPVIIKNCGGQVTISSSASVSLKLLRSKHFRISG
ncbi:MAG: hypothetical protein WA958_17785, partial [Tunicatimonas sp.]